MSITEWFGDLALESRLEELAEAIIERRPGLEIKMSAGPRGRRVLTIPIGASKHIAITVGVENARDDPSWMILTPGHTSNTYWELSLPLHAIVEAALATCAHVSDETHTVMPLTGPVRWHEPEHGPVTELADALTVRGVGVDNVIGANRLGNFLSSAGYRRRRIGAEFGQAVRIKCHWGDPTVALREGVGWVMDVPGHAKYGEPDSRWPLPCGFTTPIGTARDGGAEGVAELADVVAERARLSMDQYFKATRQFKPRDDWDALRRALFTLGTWGLRGTDRRVDYDEDGVELQDAFIVLHEGTKQVGKPLLSRRLGEKYGMSKPIIFLSRSGYSRDARAMADSLGLLLFQFTRDAVHPASGAARRVAVQPLPEDSHF